MNIDLIKDDKEFEHFCKWIARDSYGPDVFLYSKYNQNGIDIYWTNKGKYYVIQCKQRTTPKPSELIGSLENDFTVAKEYFGDGLKQFIFATTASLEVAESKISRKGGNKESLLDVCNRLSGENSVDVVLWHWDYIQEKVLESPFLLRHLLNREEGADLINDNFLESHIVIYKGIDERRNKLEFYGGNDDIQWYGIHQNFDAPREFYNSVIECISNSFNSPEPIATVIRGEGGSGKSVFLRRLAIDLKEKYTTYWIANNVETFLDNELLYDIKRHPESQYIIILEDWYRNIEKVGNKAVAQQLLNNLKKMSNARLVIGDRKDKKKIYDDYVASSHIYDLLNFENQKLLKVILVKMPEWENLIADVELNDVSNATLFIALFVFCYSEYSDNKAPLIDRYKRIFKSDYNRLIEKNSLFEIGLANTLYLYANLYGSKNYGINISIQTFVDWVCFNGNCSVPPIYASDFRRLLENSILKKYLKIEAIKTKFSGLVQKVRFHHDTMAELGWANNHELVEIEFNEKAINDLIELLKKGNHLYDLRLLYYRLSKQLGEKGKIAAREYLNSEKSYVNFNAFCFCLDLLKGEEVSKQAARDFLKIDNPYVNYPVFCACLDLLKGEKVAKQAATDFLKTDNPHVNYWAFSACLDLLKDEKVAKQAATDFLKTDNPHLHKEAFSACLDLLKDEEVAKQTAKDFLKIDNPHLQKEAFSVCLDLLKDEEVAKQAAMHYITKYLEGNKDTEFIPDVFCVSLDILGEFELTKKAAIKYLQNDNAIELQRPFNKSLKLLGEDAQPYAVEILRNYSAESNWNYAFESIKILRKIHKYYNLIEQIIQTILQNKKQSWHQYREILKIPLFNHPIWVNETEYLIQNWKYQTGFNRNYLFSLLNDSYREFPEKLHQMSIGIIRNWKSELTSKTKHKAYFTRCLANIGITGKEELKSEVVQICKEICVHHTKMPLELTRSLEMWLQKIATLSEFPKWKYEENTKEETE